MGVGVHIKWIFFFTLTDGIAVAEEIRIGCDPHYLSAGARAMIQQFLFQNVSIFMDFKVLFCWFPPKHLLRRGEGAVF